MRARGELTRARRWVIKIGSTLLTDGGRGLHREAIADWVAQMAELRARVRALGRRGPIERQAAICLGDARLELGSRRASIDGREIPITAREWAILDILVHRRDRVVSRASILELVWGDASEGASASLDVLMARIRRKLGAEAIRTVRGEGYVATPR